MADRQNIMTRVISAAIFILMEIAAVYMLKNAGELQNIWINKASHRVSAWLWGGFDEISHYFSLREENDALAQENFRLAGELRNYKDALAAMNVNLPPDSLGIDPDFNYIPATIVKVSRNKQHNYFILNKGYEDGVYPPSGVVTASGIVGIVDAVDKHYCYGRTFMNTGVSISARLGGEGAVGMLAWDGITMDKGVLKDIPLQYKYSPGDTVWTSGFSSIFPPDIPLGIAGGSKVVNGAVNEIDVTLFQSFSALKYVTIATNNGREEILYLENLENTQED